MNIFRSQNLCVSKKQIHHYASILLSPVKKVIWSESGEKSAQIKQRLQAKTVLNKYSMLVDSDVRRQQEMDFFAGESVIMDYGPVWFEVKTVLMFLFFSNMQLFSW